MDDDFMFRDVVAESDPGTRNRGQIMEVDQQNGRFFVQFMGEGGVK